MAPIEYIKRGTMTTEQVAAALATKRKGTIFTLRVARPAKLRAGSRDMDIVKASVMQGMANTDYASRGPVREAVALGERDAPALPKHIEKTFTENDVKFWKGHNGEIYLPVCLTGNHAEVTWLQDGEEVSLDEIKDHLLASEYASRTDKDDLAERGQVPFIGVNVKHIESVN
jgi:hypothetical protein